MDCKNGHGLKPEKVRPTFILCLQRIQGMVLPGKIRLIPFLFLITLNGREFCAWMMALRSVFSSECKCKCKCRDCEDKHTCPLYIAFCSGLGHQHTKGADGSRYQSIYEPTEPSQPMMSDDVSDEDRPQHRETKTAISSRQSPFKFVVA